ncbi:GNAT family N-acetyltransferase [Octadecabacter sp. G9-8]|uniref:GNAT family N-acetyltransferase n=1 Tax=Octadecabacter dasysiphoniae TaxID=2909341 RepID=A0ABS9CW54_9RHOB|nr:GNAT family N-acetyltransferase [Octadecabacter dasysiphoniae]MCF2871508.1 GNAT family N-acetyltransferase [Octadecabacter dasysiphoniae]
MTFDVRDMHRNDVPACVEIINHIIALGGSTAYEDPYTEPHFADHYLDEPPVTNVVLLGTRLVGFQAAFDIGDGLYSIGSFTDQQNPARGAGHAIFAKTLADCRAHGGTAILAKITSDNTGGLAYYSKMGFEPDTIWKDDHTRRDGTTVDRIVKRYTL